MMEFEVQKVTNMDGFMEENTKVIFVKASSYSELISVWIKNGEVDAIHIYDKVNHEIIGLPTETKDEIINFLEGHGYMTQQELVLH